MRARKRLRPRGWTGIERSVCHFGRKVNIEDRVIPGSGHPVSGPEDVFWGILQVPTRRNVSVLRLARMTLLPGMYRFHKTRLGTARRCNCVRVLEMLGCGK
jgi:hypothetical protein